MVKWLSIAWLCLVTLWIVTSCTSSQLDTAMRVVEDVNHVADLASRVAGSPAAQGAPLALRTGIELIAGAVLATTIFLRKVLPLLARKPKDSPNGPGV